MMLHTPAAPTAGHGVERFAHGPALPCARLCDAVCSTICGTAYLPFAPGHDHMI